jgi:hypothetical protein
MSSAAGGGPEVSRQPSLFGVDARDPTPEDLAGLLAGPGELGRMGGTAQVSVAVDGAWRVHVLVAELARRSLPASWEFTGDSAGRSGPEVGFTVRTAYTTRLVPLARAWCGGPPPGLHLDGQALRLWLAAAGAPSAEGWLLHLGQDERAWPAVGAALSAVGLAAALVVPGRPRTPPGVARPAAYRITGRRRLARLVELVGDPPPAAPPGAWPARPGRS